MNICLETFLSEMLTNESVLMKLLILNCSQLPTAEKRPSSLSVLEVDDPKLSVLLHLMTPMTSIEPDLESPLARPLMQQRNVAAEILGEVGTAKSATEGMLLANMELNGQHTHKFSYFTKRKNCL